MNKLEKQVYKTIFKKLYPGYFLSYENDILESLSAEIVEKVKREYLTEPKPTEHPVRVGNKYK